MVLTMLRDAFMAKAPRPRSIMAVNWISAILRAICSSSADKSEMFLDRRPLRLPPMVELFLRFATGSGCSAGRAKMLWVKQRARRNDAASAVWFALVVRFCGECCSPNALCATL